MSLIADPNAHAQAGADPLTQPLIDPAEPGPIRSELFGPERLEAHARRLAEVCALAPVRKAASPLLRRFAENERFLGRAQERINRAGEQGEDRGLGLDAEWLLDNFHIVEEVLREVQQDLPSGYDEELPKLAVDPARGYPRVHAMALALLAHNDSELDESRISQYVQAFQEIAPLRIGELWALPTMLRLVVLENLRRLSEQMLWGWDERRRAERFAAEVMEQSKATSEESPSTIKRPALDPPPFANPSDPAVVRLSQLLRDKGLTAAVALSRIEHELDRHGTDLNGVIRREHRRQAANQVSVANCVISLRVLSAIDWNDFFERHNKVEAILREDPSGVYLRQDFATRDLYRRTLEELAKGSDADEVAVAMRVARAGPIGYRCRRSGDGACRLLPDRSRARDSQGRAKAQARRQDPCRGRGAGATQSGLFRIDRRFPRSAARNSTGVSPGHGGIRNPRRGPGSPPGADRAGE